MKKNRIVFFLQHIHAAIFAMILGVSTLFLQGCDRDDPSPPNEEEVITTLQITLAPQGGGTSVLLKFHDADGEQGSIEPVISVSGPLQASTTYDAVVDLTNEAASPPVSISEEIAEEADDHLFCYDLTGDISISYEDEDANGLPLGLVTTWVTGAPGAASVTVTLRHQAGTKTGECPGAGESDAQVTFDLIVQ